MSYLLAISIGPVQEFIAAGRRTNDLYAGSNLISKIARAAAKAVQEPEGQSEGELIFPAPEVIKDPKSGAANKILAVVSGDPKKIAEKAEEAAQNCLRHAWNKAFEELTPQQRNHINAQLVEQQIAHFLEFYAAWWPWDGQDGESYREARKNVERLLAGRKALRDFTQPQKQSVPKSPLDPSRDTVITDTVACKAPPLRLKGNEWLDAASVLKRIKGSGSDVPSTADIAARTRELALSCGGPQEKQKLALLHQIAKQGFLGHLVFKSLRDDIRKENIPGPELNQVREVEATFNSRDLTIPESAPYFAILVADGDRMGDLISQMESKEKHQKFSKQLAEFAGSAKETVESHQGHLVYSGGDDVLALLPMHTALSCAARLAQGFKDRIKDGTLSVGIAIVHYHEPLYISLRQAREAEAKAKRCGRNRLALTLHLRGGQERTAVWKWEDGYDYSSWRLWIDAFQGGLSHGFPYELEKLARETEDTDLEPKLLQDEALRIFNRKKKSDAATAKVNEDPIRAALKAISSHEDFAALAQRLILFRDLARYPMQWEANQ